jgi:hypothetical protein
MEPTLAHPFRKVGKTVVAHEKIWHNCNRIRNGGHYHCPQMSKKRVKTAVTDFRPYPVLKRVSSLVKLELKFNVSY